ncbi:MAG: hypothetical protein JRF64_01830 [Deltaproteobacteria bacterium]|nr:hypothetical protein [Deltaproteobacteria bacterium]
MKRREFLQCIMAASLGHRVVRSSPVFADSSAGNLDRFGGWTGRRFKSTGYFRLEKDDRWWLVTPEGNAFLSFGINHLYPDLWKQAYNSAAWKRRLGLEELSGPAFFAALRSWFLDTCQQYGFNTVGVHTSLPVVNTPRPALPYMQPIHFVDIPHWKAEIPDSNFPDVFSSEFEQHCNRLAQKIVTPVRDDPYLLGYAMTDCPLFTEEDCRERPDVIGGARRKARVGWPRRLRNLPADAPGKQAYVRTMRDLYRGQISDFNATYETQFRSFDVLASAVNWRPHTRLSNGNETRDNVEFLKRVVARYYQTARDAIRRYDSNHLFVGDKINANTDTLDTVLPVTSQFTDIVFYQMYARYEVQQPGLDRWSKIADKPFINGDSAFTMITDSMPRPYGPVADNLQQRAEWTEEFFRNAFARPEFVGWHYCGLIDASNLVPRKQDRQHSGLLNGYGEPYPELEKVLQACTDQMYSIAVAG